jgi:hypothetical protein
MIILLYYFRLFHVLNPADVQFSPSAANFIKSLKTQILLKNIWFGLRICKNKQKITKPTSLKK